MQISIRIVHHLQIAQQILDLPTVKETLGADHAIGYVPLTKRHFELSALSIGAEENGKAFPRCFFAGAECLDFISDELCFLLRAGHSHQAYRMFAFLIRTQCFLSSAGIVTNQSIGTIKHLAGAAVVLFQLDDGRIREKTFKFQDIGYLCTSPAVDGLVIITHYTDIVLRADKLPQQTHLQRVCILKLIDGNKGKAFIPLFMHIRIAAQQALRQYQQIVKINSILRLQFTHVSACHSGYQRIFNLINPLPLISHPRHF